MASRSAARGAHSDKYRCCECGWTTIKWAGRCGECQAWGTVEEVGQVTTRTAAAVRVARPAVPIGEVDAAPARSVSTGVSELDRVLGGGLVSGAVVLVAGEPGIGKSTLLLDVAARAARTGRVVLYVTGEESAAQVRLRAQRIGALAPTLYLAAEGDLAATLGQVEKLGPDLLVVDSVQTIASAEVDGSPGNVSQVREVAAAIIAAAKRRDMAAFLVGHVTKDGSIAGPRVLEHLVDVVVQFEGERHSRLRLLRAVKNRYGPTDEVGCFDLTDAGIEGVPDPSGLFMSRPDLVVPGTGVTVTLEGRRPLVAEMQALLAPSSAPSPRRTTSGLESSRVSMLLAVLDRRARLPVARCDCYVSTVGGVRVGEPGADLAVALAMASSVLDRPLPEGLICVGEVGLAGEVRPVGGVDRRLAEGARIGFTKAVIPAGSLRAGQSAPEGMQVIQVTDIREAVHLMTVADPGAGYDARRAHGAMPRAGSRDGGVGAHQPGAPAARPQAQWPVGHPQLGPGGFALPPTGPDCGPPPPAHPHRSPHGSARPGSGSTAPNPNRPAGGAPGAGMSQQPGSAGNPAYPRPRLVRGDGP